MRQSPLSFVLAAFPLFEEGDMQLDVKLAMQNCLNHTAGGWQFIINFPHQLLAALLFLSARLQTVSGYLSRKQACHRAKSMITISWYFTGHASQKSGVSEPGQSESSTSAKAALPEAACPLRDAKPKGIEKQDKDSKADRRRLQGDRENLLSDKGVEPANFKTSAAQRNISPFPPWLDSASDMAQGLQSSSSAEDKGLQTALTSERKNVSSTQSQHLPLLSLQISAQLECRVITRRLLVLTGERSPGENKPQLHQAL